MGVIVTLIYLALQIKQNTHAMEESQRMARVSAMLQRNDVMERSNFQSALNPEILEIRLRAEEEGVDSLTRLERERLKLYELARMVRAEAQFFQWEHGYLDDIYYNEQFTFVVQRYASLWRELGLDYGRPSFKAAIEDVRSKMK